MTSTQMSQFNGHNNRIFLFKGTGHGHHRCFKHPQKLLLCVRNQSKIAPHLRKHEATELDIAKAFLLPKKLERKRAFEKLRNKGNYEHNQDDRIRGNQMPDRMYTVPTLRVCLFEKSCGATWGDALQGLLQTLTHLERPKS